MKGKKKYKPRAIFSLYCIKWQKEIEKYKKKKKKNQRNISNVNF